MIKPLIPFLISLSLLLASCQAQAPRQDFVVAIESYPAQLDPRYPSDAYSSKVQKLIFNGLLKIDENLQLVPDLAERFEIVSDTRLRIQLRSDVKFHHGKNLTAQDVIYTYRSMMDPSTRSPHHQNFKKIKKLSSKDEYSLEIELREAFVPFLTALTVGIIPKDSDILSELAFRKRPIGSGPFQFDSLRKDQWLRLRAFEEYFEKPPKIKNLSFKTIRDDTTRVLELIRGEVDLVQNAVPLKMAHWLLAHQLSNGDKLIMKRETGVNYAYLGFNLRDSILSKKTVREALAYALNRKDLIQYQLKGFAKEATGLLAKQNPFFEGEVSQAHYNPELAKHLLDQAGFPDPDGKGPGKRFILSYKTSNKRDRVAMARAIARQLDAVGVGIEIKAYEWGTFYRDIRTGNFQMFSSTWVGISDPDIYYYVFHSSMIPPQGANRGYYVNEQVDSLLELARRETDEALRKQYYSQVQKMLALELPYLSLWYEDNVVFMQPNVEDYELRPDASFLGLVKTWKKN